VIGTRDVRLIVDENEIGIEVAKLCGSRLQSGLLDCVHAQILYIRAEF